MAGGQSVHILLPARLWSAMCSVGSSTTSKPSSNNDTQPTYSVVRLKARE